jgi:hypothetical protein
MNNKVSVVSARDKVSVVSREVRGITYLVDPENGSIYHTEDIVAQRPNPRRVGVYYPTNNTIDLQPTPPS